MQGRNGGEGGRGRGGCRCWLLADAVADAGWYAWDAAAAAAATPAEPRGCLFSKKAC